MDVLVGLVGKLILLGAEASGAPTPPQAPPGEALSQLVLMFGSLGLIFYLLIWRPESKRRKQQEETLNSIKPKDKVVTIGGLFGTVVEVDKDEVVLLVDTKREIKMRFRRRAIESIEPAEGKK
ncbi:MAG: preprotein translocase subunit YajC [Planctomycetota bacterium]|nr:preprotein translocase subunit YajC [Planctomycetota bacterium]